MVQRHNEVRDSFNDLSALVWRQVSHEPVVQEPNSTENLPTLIADLAVMGVWTP